MAIQLVKKKKKEGRSSQMVTMAWISYPRSRVSRAALAFNSFDIMVTYQEAILLETEQLIENISKVFCLFVRLGNETSQLTHPMFSSMRQ